MDRSPAPGFRGWSSASHYRPDSRPPGPGYTRPENRTPFIPNTTEPSQSNQLGQGRFPPPFPRFQGNYPPAMPPWPPHDRFTRPPPNFSASVPPPFAQPPQIDLHQNNQWPNKSANFSQSGEDVHKFLEKSSVNSSLTVSNVPPRQNNSPYQSGVYDQQKTDQEWVKSWLASRQIKSQSPTPQCSDKTLKERLAELKVLLTDEARLEDLSSRIKKAKKKRARLKRKRKADYEEKLQNEQERKLKHAKIDQWLEEIEKRGLEAKKEKQLKAAADETLKEVVRKLADVSKVQDCLTSLKKLRQIRADRMKHQGLPVSRDIENSFTERTQKMADLLANQRKQYETEKKTLEVMLQGERDELKKKEMSLLKKKREREEQKKEKQISSLLFGSKDLSWEDPAMLPFTQYYDAASSSTDSLIHIRREWDDFLVHADTPGASSVPPGWVTPCPPSSAAWAACLQPSPSS